MVKGAVNEASLSLKRLRGGGLGGEIIHWGPWKICWRALGMGHNSARNSLRGPGGSFTGNLTDEVFQRYAKCPVGGPPFT